MVRFDLLASKFQLFCRSGACQTRSRCLNQGILNNLVGGRGIKESAKRRHWVRLGDPMLYPALTADWIRTRLRPSSSTSSLLAGTKIPYGSVKKLITSC